MTLILIIWVDCATLLDHRCICRNVMLGCSSNKHHVVVGMNVSRFNAFHVSACPNGHTTETAHFLPKLSDSAYFRKRHNSLSYKRHRTRLQTNVTLVTTFLWKFLTNVIALCRLQASQHSCFQESSHDYVEFKHQSSIRRHAFLSIAKTSRQELFKQISQHSGKFIAERFHTNACT